MPQRTINFTNGYHVECTFLSEELVHEGNWLRFFKVKYLDPEGNEKNWEAISRVTRPQGNDTDGVTAIAIYRRMLHYDVIVLVRQYRPALKAYTIEFPSGLLEPGECCEAAAVRTLKNETGWNGEITHISRPLAVDPGCSSAVLRYATVKINGDALNNKNYKPQPKEGEFVDLIMIPLSEIHDQLERLTKEGHIIDSRVAIWSIGLQMGLKVAKNAEIDAASTSQSSLPLDGSCVRTGLGSQQIT